MMLGTVRPMLPALSGPFHLGTVGCGANLHSTLRRVRAAAPSGVLGSQENRRRRGYETQVLIWLMGFAVGSLEVYD